MRLVFLLALCSLRLFGQGPTPPPSPITATTVTPTGACSVNQGRLVGPAGTIYTCESGTWAQVGGSSGGGPAGSLNCAQFYLDSTHFGCAANDGGPAIAIYTVDHPGAFGMTGLQIGPPEPDLSCCDGAANSISIASEGVLVENRVSSNTIDRAYYISNGTLASPTNISNGANLLTDDILGYVGGAYTYLATEEWLYNTSYVTRLTNTSGTAIDLEIGYVSGTDQTPAVGWSPIGNTPVVELNNGTPVADGGALAQLTVGIVNATSYEQGGIAVGSAGAAICWKTTTTLSYCTSIVGAGGTCTCH